MKAINKCSSKTNPVFKADEMKGINFEQWGYNLAWVWLKLPWKREEKNSTCLQTRGRNSTNLELNM